MKIREYSKAIAALVGSISTFLVTVNAPPQWQLYVGGLAAILTTLATFGVPNTPPLGAAEKVVTTLDDIQGKVTEAQAQAQGSLDAVTKSAVDSITKIQQTLGMNNIPIVGQVANQVDSMVDQALDAFRNKKK